MRNARFLIRVEKLTPEGLSYAGTGFLIHPDGLFITAAHNFELGLLNEFRATHEGIQYPITRTGDVRPHTDFCAYRIVARELPSFGVVHYRHRAPSSLLGKNAIALGFDERDGRLKVLPLSISDYHNGIYQLSGAIVPFGFSGAPVICEGAVIGVVTSRKSPDTCYASSLYGSAEELGILRRTWCPQADEIEAYLLDQSIGRLYREIGNPNIAYEISQSMVDGATEKLAAHPISFARIKISLAYMLINADADLTSLAIAVNHLEDALTSLYTAELSDSIIRLIVRANWLMAIVRRLQGNRIEAEALCRESLMNRALANADYETKLPLIREIAVSTNDTQLFDSISRKLENVFHDQVETFYTARRLLEHSLHLGDISAAERHLLVADNSFKLAKHRIFKVYEASLLKNKMEFYIALQDSNIAHRYYFRALKLMNDYQLFGQMRSLNNLASNSGLFSIEEAPLAFPPHE